MTSPNPDIYGPTGVFGDHDPSSRAAKRAATERHNAEIWVAHHDRLVAALTAIADRT